ncbi:MAG: TonB-dependent receptor, partial [Rikenellaceae bacterium]|nr:TonB-dependent receptor [Rikenellaceae bacterium]
MLAVFVLQIFDIQAQSLSERVITLTEAVVDTTFSSEIAQPIGQKNSTFGKMTLHSGRSRELGEVLAANSSIYIKSMGRGSLATASIRGTSSNHTQVLWNGMPINSSMVGSFDFSTIPTFFLDRVTLALGAADSRGVSGVLGGTIRLESVAAQSGAETLIEYGSNNTQTYGISAGYKLGNVSMSTRGWLQSSDNDFQFLNKVLSKDPFYARRTDSDYTQGGVMQQFATQIGHTALKADFWAMWGERSLPQPIVVSHTSSESQKDLSVRSTLSA